MVMSHSRKNLILPAIYSLYTQVSKLSEVITYPSLSPDCLKTYYLPREPSCPTWGIEVDAR